MYRVVTQYRNGTARPIIERGPWHPTRPAAEHWAQILRDHGYDTHVESQGGQMRSGDLDGNDKADLAAALASMA